MPVMNNYYILPSYFSKLCISLHAGKSRGVFVAKRATDRMPPVGRGSEALLTGNRCVRPPITKRSTEPSRRQGTNTITGLASTPRFTHTYTCDNPGVQNQLPSLNQVLQYTARRQKITARTS